MGSGSSKQGRITRNNTQRNKFSESKWEKRHLDNQTDEKVNTNKDSEQYIIVDKKTDDVERSKSTNTTDLGVQMDTDGKSKTPETIPEQNQHREKTDEHVNANANNGEVMSADVEESGKKGNMQSDEDTTNTSSENSYDLKISDKERVNEVAATFNKALDCQRTPSIDSTTHGSSKIEPDPTNKGTPKLDPDHDNINRDKKCLSDEHAVVHYENRQDDLLRRVPSDSSAVSNESEPIHSNGTDYLTPNKSNDYAQTNSTSDKHEKAKNGNPDDKEISDKDKISDIDKSFLKSVKESRSDGSNHVGRDTHSLGTFDGNGENKSTINTKVLQENGSSDESLVEGTPNDSPYIENRESLGQQNIAALNIGSSTETPQIRRSEQEDENFDSSLNDETKDIFHQTEKKQSLKDWVERDNNEKLRANIEFYENKIRSRPLPGHKITDMLGWCGDYGKLERNHQYIQWLFPMYDSSGMNSYAQPLQKHEADTIQETPELKERVLKAFKMMLEFYGMKLDGLRYPKFSRADNIWKERYEHLNGSFHNHLRITRIMRSIGYLGYQHLQYPWLKFILEEAHAKDSLLPRLQGGCIRYWIESLENQNEQEAAVELLSNFDIQPIEKVDPSNDNGDMKKNESYNDNENVDNSLDTFDTNKTSLAESDERDKNGVKDTGSRQCNMNNQENVSIDNDGISNGNQKSSNGTKSKSKPRYDKSGRQIQNDSYKIDNFTTGEGGGNILNHDSGGRDNINRDREQQNKKDY